MGGAGNKHAGRCLLGRPSGDDELSFEHGVWVLRGCGDESIAMGLLVITRQTPSTSCLVSLLPSG